MPIAFLLILPSVGVFFPLASLRNSAPPSDIFLFFHPISSFNLFMSNNYFTKCCELHSCVRWLRSDHLFYWCMFFSDLFLLYVKGSYRINLRIYILASRCLFALVLSSSIIEYLGFARFTSRSVYRFVLSSTPAVPFITIVSFVLVPVAISTSDVWMADSKEKSAFLVMWLS